MVLLGRSFYIKYTIFFAFFKNSKLTQKKNLHTIYRQGYFLLYSVIKRNNNNKYFSKHFCIKIFSVEIKSWNCNFIFMYNIYSLRKTTRKVKVNKILRKESKK